MHSADHSDHTLPSEHTHESHVRLYGLVFLALCVLTGLSVAADAAAGALPSKIALACIVLAIATAKALFVMLYFMHLKFEGRWKYVLLAPTIVLALAMIVTLSPDIAFHYYRVQVPQTQAGKLDPHETHGTGEVVGEQTPH